MLNEFLNFSLVKTIPLKTLCSLRDDISNITKTHFKVIWMFKIKLITPSSNGHYYNDGKSIICQNDSKSLNFKQWQPLLIFLLIQNCFLSWFSHLEGFCWATKHGIVQVLKEARNSEVIQQISTTHSDFNLSKSLNMFIFQNKC